MSNFKQEPLRNTIQIREAADVEYAQIPEGQAVVALMRIKNITYENKWGTGPGFRFVFRSRDIADAFVHIDVTSKTGSKKAGLRKLIVGMSGGTLPDNIADDPDALFNFMQRLLDHWFLVNIEHQEWTPKNSTDTIIFTRIAGQMVMPHPDDKKLGNASEYFKKNTQKKDLAAESVDFDNPAKPEEMHFYKFADFDALGPKQVEFIKKNGGKHTGGGVVVFGQDMPNLAKFKWEPPKEETHSFDESTIGVFDDDNIPW